MKDLEELKKAFIVGEEFRKEKIQENITRVLRYCRVDTAGTVYIEFPKLTTKEKVKLVLVARFLANKLEPQISLEVSANELSDSLNIPKNQINARLKETLDEKFSRRVKVGVYSASPYYIDRFIDELDRKYRKGE